jgi:hypothetical protein
VAVAAWAFAGLQAAIEFVEPRGFFWALTPLARVPFTDPRTIAAALLIGSAWAAATVVGTALARRWALAASVVLVALLLPTQLPVWLAALGWLALALGLLVIETRLPSPTATITRAITWGAYALIALAALVALAAVASPARLAVPRTPARLAPGDLIETISVYVGLACTLVVAARLASSPVTARALRALAGGALVFLASVVLVDLVPVVAGESVPFEEVQKQAQVALSVLWSVIGGMAFVAGLVLTAADVRRAGLALLALASTKVFLVDLAALDVAYRVLSLVALGLLLLGSAYLYQRLRPLSDTSA